MCTDPDIPRIGGVAVFAAIPVAVLAAASAKAAFLGAVPEFPELAGALVLSAAILFAVGLVDDIRRVQPLIKLLAQTIAALVIYYAGFSIEHVSLVPGHALDLGVLALPVTILWLVGISNAFNLIDGMDGLAGGVAIIGLLATAVAALFLGNPTVPIYSIALIGALVGFLRYNWPAAGLFMGDSGSLVVGFLVAIFSVKAATDSQHLTHGLIPLFALAYPLLDTGLAMLRRWLRGVPLSRADRRHIHHQLLSLGLPPTKALFSIYGAAGSVAALGLLAAFAPTEITFATSIFGLAILLAIVALSINRLKYHEFADAGSSLANAARSAPWVIRDKINARDVAALIQRANNVEDVQEILERSASLFRLAHMKLATPESRYRLPSRVSQELQALRLWKLEYPIVQGKLEDHDALSLTIWCALEGTLPSGAERVAQILGPAIAEWADSGKMRPAAHSYGDRPIRLEYTPRLTHFAIDRALLNKTIWDPKIGEKSLEA